MIVESRDVQFFEYKTRNDFTNESSKSLLGGVDETNTPTNTPNSYSSSLLVNKENTNIQKQVEIRKSQKTRKEKVLDPDFILSSYCLSCGR